jgi:hypothetical protein
MTSFDLFGIPENPTLASLLPPVGINFAKLLDGVFAPNGTDGCPDPVTDPLSCFTYMVNKANLITKSAQQRPMMRLADQNLNVIAEIVGELSCDTEELMSDTGQARVIITYDNYLVDWMVNQIQVFTDVHLIIDPTPTQRSWRTRWGGKVHQINVKRNEDGTSTVELLALSMREHAKKLLIAAAPAFAPEIQIPRIWVLPGPIRTILFATFMINLARLFVPGWSTITNAFNPLSWINPAVVDQNIVADFNPLSWPIQVAFVNPLLDQSRWTAIGATWTDWHSSTTDMLKDCGVILRGYTYLADEDTDSPHTELADLITGVEEGAIDILDALNLSSADQLVEAIGDAAVETLATPTRNCVIFSLEDMSGQAGPTGTALDGLLNLIGVTFDDLFTSILINADTGQTLDGEPVIDVINPTAPIAETLLGVAPQAPNVIWRESTFDRVLSKQHSLYKAPPLTMMTGGRSPTLVNEAQTFGIQYGLSQLQFVITADETGLFGGAGEGGPPIGAGLSSLYQGQLDNVLLAWERITDPTRAAWTGDLAYQEHFERGTQTAYTLAGIITLRQADFNTRAYYGFQAQVISGFPWVLDVDVRLGERAGWEYDGVIYVDQLTAIKRTWDRQNPVLCTLSVGDDRDKQDPVARTMRSLNAFYGMFAGLLGEGTLFG